MNPVIGSVRALLRDFVQSPWGQCHARTPTWEVYFNRGMDGVNPMIRETAVAAEIAAAPALVAELTAPHLGLFEPSVAEGAHVQQGETVGQLRVLDRITPIEAEAGGTIEFLAAKGALVEFGMGMLRVRGG